MQGRNQDFLVCRISALENGSQLRNIINEFLSKDKRFAFSFAPSNAVCSILLLSIPSHSMSNFIDSHVKIHLNDQEL